FVRRRALPDLVHRGHLVVIGLPVRQRRIRIRQDVGDGRDQGKLAARDGPAVDLVIRDWRSAVGGRRRPRQRDACVSRRGDQVPRGPWGGVGRGRGRRGFVRQRSIYDRVHGGDFVVIRVPVRHGRVRVRQDIPDRVE